MRCREILIIAEAESCSGGECGLDEVESLITSLQSQQSQLSARVAEMNTLIADLEKVNALDERPVDEVRETVRAIFRVFQSGVSCSFHRPPRNHFPDQIR